MMKTLLLPMAILFCVNSTNAQLPKPFQASAAFAENLAKITQAFRNNYYNLQGEKLPADDNMDTYKSTVTLPGAQHCVIYRFHSKEDTSASWQAIMYTGDNYKNALKIYKNACKQVDKTKVNLGNNIMAAFTGKIDEPETDLRFVSSIFRLNTKDTVYEKFYVEVELVNINYADWEVRVNLQSSKRDDEEK